MRTRLAAVATASAIALVPALASCGDSAESGPTAGPGASTSAPSTPAETASTPPVTPPASSPTTPTAPLPGTVPPDWLGTRVLPIDPDTGVGRRERTPKALRTRRFNLPDTVAMLPGDGFESRIVDPAPDDVIARSTWEQGCPVGRDELAWVRVVFHGFDGERHTGELLVNSSAAADLVQVFSDLYDDQYPIEQMKITTRAERDAEPTGDGNDTGAFNCRPVTGGTSYSRHAYGLAVDVNPFQNPYLKGEMLLPELAGAYLDRDREAPGIIHPDGPVVRAFARIGWSWGGAWHSLKDFQHFSDNGS